MKGDKILYKEGYKYQLYADYSIQTKIRPSVRIITRWIVLDTNGLLIIRSGYAWDGPSGPTIDTLNSLRASLVHDALYQLMRLGLLEESYREYADQLLHDLCVEDGMADVRADIWHAMVRAFAAGSAKVGTERKVLEAPNCGK